MGTKRIGLARVEALIENLKRNVDLTDATLTDCILTTSKAVTLSGDSTIAGSKANFRYDVQRGYDRWYLEDYFRQLPGVSADIDQAYTVEVARALNKNFELLGTNKTTALATFDHDYSGMTMTTGTTDNDQMICLPHLDSKQSAWGVAGQFDSQKSVEWAARITTGAAITTYAFWAGLKLTNVPAYATDADQAYFVFATDDGPAGALTSNANLHFVHSIGGVDYISDLGIAVAADTTYSLKIAINSSRKATIFVNGTQYSPTTATTAGGVDVSAGTNKTAALTDNAAFIPYIGVQCLAGSAARALRVHYQKISTAC